MKFLISIFLTIVLTAAVTSMAWYSTSRLWAVKDKQNRIVRATMHFEAGCYVGADSSCSIIKNDFLRSDCYEAVLKGCPESAIKYGAWIKRNLR